MEYLKHKRHRERPCAFPARSGLSAVARKSMFHLAPKHCTALLEGLRHFPLFLAAAGCPSGAETVPCRARNRAMPLPVADEGIAGFLQRSENRRKSVSPNDSPGTARRYRLLGSIKQGTGNDPCAFCHFNSFRRTRPELPEQGPRSGSCSRGGCSRNACPPSGASRSPAGRRPFLPAGASGTSRIRPHGSGTAP